MSAAAPLRRPAALRLPATAAPAQRKPVAHSRPRLVLVSQRRPTAGRLPFLILIGAVLVAGLVGVLLLHMLAAQDAYRANTLQQELGTLNDRTQELATVVESDSSPSSLQQRAVALGMVPTGVSKFHKLHDGRAVGVQTPVYVPPPVTHTAPPATSTKTVSTKTTTSKTTSTKKTSTARQKHHHKPSKP